MTEPAFASLRAARRGGMRHALGMPAFGLAAAFIGFGVMAREAEIGLWVSMFSTMSIWAAPAQVMMVELYTAGASLGVILIGIAVVNMRFLPMSASLMPLLAEGQSRRWPLYFVVYYLAIMSWAYSMRLCPGMPPDQRIPYFTGFALTVMTAGTLATGLGYILAGHVTPEVKLALIALPPIYLVLVFVDGVRDLIGRIALIGGALVGPAFHLLSPRWGLMLTGLVAGTLAYAVDRRRRGHSRGSATGGG